MEEIIVSSLSADKQLAVIFNPENVRQQVSISPQELAVRERLTVFQKLTSYTLPSFAAAVSGDNFLAKGFNDSLQQETNPLVAQDRNEAVEKINKLLLKIDKIKEDLQISIDSKPVCPYEQTKLEYLGPNFIVPTIHDLALPTKFSVSECTNAAILINKNRHDTMLSQLQMMSAEAAKPNFSGNLSECLGHAFTVLSATANGEEYVIDRHKTALHLEFAEIVRNIPISYIIENPLIVAQKLIARFIEINKDSLKEELTMITE